MANNSLSLNDPVGAGAAEQQKGKMDWADTNPKGANPPGPMDGTKGGGELGDRDDDDFDASMSMSVTAANK